MTFYFQDYWYIERLYKIRATIRYFFIGSFVIRSESLSLLNALSSSFIFTWTLQYAKMLAIAVHENMKLGDNTLNNERLTLVNTKFQPKY